MTLVGLQEKKNKAEVVDYDDLHLVVKIVIEHQRMGHSDAMWLHWMKWTIMIIPNLRYKYRKQRKDPISSNNFTKK